MRHLNTLRTATLCTLTLVVALGTVGCSSTTSHHAIQHQPGVSMNAVASADARIAVQSIQLVAADSIGIATFATDIERDDQARATNASANPD